MSNMEKGKRNKLLKILLYCFIALVFIGIIAMSILASTYRDKTEELQSDNQEIEEIINA